MHSLRKKETAIILLNPKYIYNLAAAVRAAACFEVNKVIYTGNRINFNIERLPREFRMKEYESVSLIHNNRPLDLFNNITPIAVEFSENSESLYSFIHPENAVYLFGPEDGSIYKQYRCLCHRFVHISTRYCLNLGNAVNIIMYDRNRKC